MFGYILRIFAAVVLTGISAWLSYRKQEGPEPGTLDDLGNPRSDEGAEIIKIFGTVNVADPQVVWFGDFRTAPIIKTAGRRYGLFGPKNRQTIGFNYFLGLHFVLCLGAVDAILRIRVDKREIFSGAIASGRISFNHPNLFGSSEREGGVAGDIDVLAGGPAQAVNDYLASRQSAPVPAYRGVTSLVLRQGYIGNSPSLRPWDIRASRIFNVDAGYNGGVQWYAEKAAIPRGEDLAIASYSFSLSGGDIPPLQRDPASIVANNYGFVINANPTDVLQITPTMPPAGGNAFNVAMDPAANGNWIWRLVVLGDDDPDEIDVVNGTPLFTSEDTAAEALAVAQASAPYLVTGYSRYRFWVALDGSTLELADEFGGLSATVQIFQGQDDMNPVHILREILISPDCGGSGIEADAGTTWTAAADTIFTEGFGLSIAWRGGSDRAAFKREIERHIDARSYLDRRTGKWEIKLIRDDYDVETLPVFDTSNVVSWSDINFPQPETLLNQLVITWTDPTKEETASLTISNPARIRMAGSKVFSEKVDYPAIKRADLAGRVAMRDLQARSAPLMTGSFVTKNLPTDLNIGSPIIVSNPRLKFIDRVVRITEIEDGNIGDSSARVKFVEDRFAIGDESPVEIEIIEPEVIVPLPVDPRLVEEAPYYLTVDRLGAPNAEAVYTADPDAGFLFIAGAEPSPTSNEAIVQRDSGTGYEELEAITFVPAATTLGAMTNRADHEKVVVQSADALASVAVGSLAWLDGEHVTVTLIEAGDTSGPGDYWDPTLAADDAVYTVTFARGCLDTVPAAHAVGAGIIFYGEIGALEDDIQTDGDSIDVKLQTVTTRGVLALADAPIDTVVFDARALRPLPPGDLRLDGDYQTDPPASGSAYVLTWEHRDRNALSLIGHSEAGPASPEASTEYVVTVEALDGAGAVLSVLTTANVADDLTYTWTPVSAPSATETVRLSVTSVRSTVESWTAPSIVARLAIGARAFEDSEENRTTEAGDGEIRTIEG